MEDPTELCRQVGRSVIHIVFEFHRSLPWVEGHNSTVAHVMG